MTAVLPVPVGMVTSPAPLGELPLPARKFAMAFTASRWCGHNAPAKEVCTVTCL